MGAACLPAGMQCMLCCVCCGPFWLPAGARDVRVRRIVLFSKQHRAYLWLTAVVVEAKVEV